MSQKSISLEELLVRMHDISAQHKLKETALEIAGHNKRSDVYLELLNTTLAELTAIMNYYTIHKD